MPECIVKLAELENAYQRARIGEIKVETRQKRWKAFTEYYRELAYHIGTEALETVRNSPEYDAIAMRGTQKG